MNITKSLLLGAAMCFAIHVGAQKKTGAIAFNGGVGYSFFGLLGSLNFSIQDEFEVDGKATPVYFGALDYGYENNISVGIGGGFQSVSQNVRNYSYIDEFGDEIISDFSYEISRLNLGLRALYHYGNGKIDAYSGGKVGLTYYRVQVDTKNVENPSWLRSGGAGFALQIIPVGVRMYVSNNIGIFIETGIGAPSFISGGICLGFGEDRSTPSN
jgi:hypothetical protein